MSENFEQQKSPEMITEFQDLRGLDLSEKDLNAISAEILTTTDFDTNTKWPKKENLPTGFSPETLFENGKNPGLGIRELHKAGVDGRGVVVAIIDQTLSSREGQFVPHVEYASKIIDYKEYGNAKNENISLHGPAVASLFVGETCGVAPGAELVYKACPSGRNFTLKAKALMDIVESNKTAEPDKMVRIVSCSIGFMEENPEPGLDDWVAAIKNAMDAGIIVVDVGNRRGVGFLGGGAISNKDDIESYNPYLYLRDKDDADFGDRMVVPSDYRTMASYNGENEYIFNGRGGISWSVPYLAGLFALALQVNPRLTQEEIADLINKTASVNKKGLKIVNPKAFIESVKNKSH